MFSCFESSSALCNALRIYFDFSRASRVSDQWIQECERMFASSQQFPSQDDKAVIVSAYIDVLEHHWRSRHTHKAKLKEILEKAIIMCPYEGSFIRRFIDIFSGGLRNLNLRRFFDGIHAKDDPTRDMYHSLSCLYMEQRRAEMLLEGGAALHSNAVALITRREAEQRRDPALWRLAMAQSRTKRCLDETYLSAAAQCGWSRHLHIDSVAASGGRAECVETIRLMEERGALLFNDLDYIDVLKEAGAAQTEVPG